jgi:phenylalanine-4-hydroxylase
LQWKAFCKVVLVFLVAAERLRKLQQELRKTIALQNCNEKLEIAKIYFLYHNYNVFKMNSTIESNPLLDRLPKHLKQFIKPQDYSDYTPINQAVWRYA